MLAGNNVTLQNGLQISVDWLSWTLSEPFDVASALSLMGYAMEDFQVLPVGMNGYRSQIRHCVHPISVQYEGNEGMGIHVDVSGSAVPDLIAHYRESRMVNVPFGGKAYDASGFDSTVFSDLLADISSNGHVTRLDLAIDDLGARYYTLTELHNTLSDGLYVSKFRNWKELVTHQNREVCGHTIYLGSRSSEIMVRVYDKQLEQSGKGSPVAYPWVRWELELKKERACQAAQLIIDGHSIAEVSVGVLSNYLRLVELDNTRIDRCSVSQKWLLFLDGISKLRLYLPKPARTLDEMKTWLNRQVAPSLATVLLCEGGSMDYVYSLLDSGASRLKKYQSDMVHQEMRCSV